jgi:PAS domain S-box-containing protein
MNASSKDEPRKTASTRSLERKLKDINERYELAAKATNDVMYDLDLRKATVVWNDALYEQYGYKRSDEAETLEWWVTRIHHEDALRVENEISEWLFSDRDTWQTEYRFQKADGRYLEVRDRGFLLRDRSGQPMRIIGTLLDITQQKQLERAKDEFISLVSHQLRTPLTIISTYSDMFIEGYFGKLSKKQNEQALRIHEASERLISLVRDMLSLSRIEMGRLRSSPQPTDINRLIATYVEGLRPIAETKGVRVTFEPNELAQLYIDASIFGQVVHNLLENAIHYSPQKEGLIHVTFDYDGKWDGYLLSVKDNGIGIKKSDQALVFERFYRAESSPSIDPNGTGLGLYLVKLVIVDLLGGRVWCKSAVGKGTTFYAFIPKDMVHTVL